MPDVDPIVELLAGDAAVRVDVANGGRIAQITVGGQHLLRDDPVFGPIAWGSYPMAPWAGRLRDARFTFNAVTHQLELNHEDSDGARHAIHGTVFGVPWTVDSATTAAVSLSCPLGSSLGWPLGGTAHQTISLDPDGVTCELSVTASTAESFPASVGWHPWFVKPDRLVFNPQGMLERDGIGLPHGRLVPPAPHPWDDTFRNVEPVELHYDAGPAVHAVTVTSDCDHWVVFDLPPHATCVEPQSGPPDALNVAPVVVTPQSPLVRRMRIGWLR